MRRSATLGLAPLVIVLIATGCVTKREVVVVEPAPGPSTAATLGVPPGHLPPPGKCRVWLPGTPPGHQPRARSCDGIVAGAPAGALILYRPTRDKRLVRVRYIDHARTGIVIRIRVFEAKSGRFLREEQVGEDGA